MSEVFVEDKEFAREDFRIDELPAGEYLNCEFVGCDFSGSSLSGVKFEDCEFIDCNFSLAKSVDTALRDCIFKNCKMLGFRFEDCGEFGFAVRFEKSVIDNSSFFGRRLKSTAFRECSLRNVDFTDADLSGATFDGCDLSNAAFVNSNLEKSDFRSAVHFTIDPEANRIRGAKFSAAGLAGLLSKHEIVIEW